MGGYTSTRWGWGSTKQDTDPVISLDVRWLYRQGALKPGAMFWPSWTRRGEPSGSIVTRMNAAGDTITLIYQTSRPGETPRDVREPIRLERTPCNYGGSRPWFTCPGCLKRRAVLYSPGGSFRGRACCNLAYSSTREDDLERSIRRTNALRRRIRDTSRGDIFRPPTGEKPAGMHWRTYWRLQSELQAELGRMNDLFVEDLGVMITRIDRTLGKRKQRH